MLLGALRLVVVKVVSHQFEVALFEVICVQVLFLELAFAFPTSCADTIRDYTTVSGLD